MRVREAERGKREGEKRRLERPSRYDVFQHPTHPAETAQKLRLDQRDEKELPSSVLVNKPELGRAAPAASGSNE